MAFLYVGCVEIDSDFLERPATKNALFAGHDECAAARRRIASLIETCKMNGVESYAQEPVGFGAATITYSF